MVIRPKTGQTNNTNKIASSAFFSQSIWLQDVNKQGSDILTWYFNVSESLSFHKRVKIIKMPKLQIQQQLPDFGILVRWTVQDVVNWLHAVCISFTFVTLY